ncbi:MAG: hypothetical protein E4H01_10095, partial [Lysobacterales bacterium]
MFERSFYVEFNGRFVCFGDVEIGNGPLNALLGEEWRDIGLRVGDPVIVDGETVWVNNRRVLELSRADIWRMPEPPAKPNAARVLGKLDTLVQAIGPFMPAGGLANLIRPRSVTAYEDPLLQYVSQ